MDLNNVSQLQIEKVLQGLGVLKPGVAYSLTILGPHKMLLIDSEYATIVTVTEHGIIDSVKKREGPPHNPYYMRHVEVKAEDNDHWHFPEIN